MLKWLLDLIDRRGHNLKELARRLDVPVQELKGVDRTYHEFQIQKKSGKPRQIAAPNDELKQLQRKILRRLLARLKSHPQATGFQPGVSFVDNARCHQAQKVIIRIDLVDFFPSIGQDRVFKYFRYIGWQRSTARLLTELVTWRGVLPQGSPTSPRLSNLVCHGLDAWLSNIAQEFGGVYTRYADDITVSLSDDYEINILVARLLKAIRQFGFRPHTGKKFDIRRGHQRQVVTGLVVNEQANLPRETRRWLRAVEHRRKKYRKGGTLCPAPTLTDKQLEGWLALQNMINAKNFLVEE